jgi:hypothetical protein
MIYFGPDQELRRFLAGAAVAGEDLESYFFSSSPVAILSQHRDPLTAAVSLTPIVLEQMELSVAARGRGSAARFSRLADLIN